MNIKSNGQGLHKVKRHFVNMCEIVVTGKGEIIEIPPLGSCVAIILYDPQRRIGGIAHCLLPQAPANWNPDDPAVGKYVDKAVDKLLEKFGELGVYSKELIAKLVGGASVINFEDDADTLNIGERNVNQSIDILKEKGIPVHGQEVGGDAGRMVEFFIDSGEVHITGSKFEKIII